MSRSFEDRGGRSPLIIKDLDLYPQPPTNTRSPTLNSEEPLKFADDKGYSLVLADHQNYYPDMTFIARDDESKKFAVDLKTTYRMPNNPENCNGFTLGSHGQYFIDRTSRKNIQFPYSEYDGHFCLGIVYDRAAKGDLDETRQYAIEDLESITSVISKAVSMGGSNEFVECFCGGAVAEGGFGAVARFVGSS